MKQPRMIAVGALTVHQLRTALLAEQAATQKLKRQVDDLLSTRKSCLVTLAAIVAEHGQEGVYVISKETLSLINGKEYVDIKGHEGTIRISVRSATTEELAGAMQAPKRIIFPLSQ